MRKKVKLFFLLGMSFQQFRPAKSENKFPKSKVSQELHLTILDYAFNDVL